MSAGDTGMKWQNLSGLICELFLQIFPKATLSTMESLHVAPVWGL